MRVRNPALLRALHLEWDECCICGATDLLHIHHVLFRSQGGDDVRANLIPLCEPHHSLYHGADPTTTILVAAYIETERPDVIEYLERKDAVNRFRQRHGR